MTIFDPKFCAGRALALAAVMLAGTAVPAMPQPPMQPMESMPSEQNSQLTAMDRSFVTDMLQETRAQLALAQLARQRASNAATVRAANAVNGEWTSLRARLTGLAIADAAPIRGALSATQHAELWHLGRTPKARFDRAFLRDAQHGNKLALNRLREEDATSNAQIRQFLAEARPLISAYQSMLTADLGRLPMNGFIGSTIQ